MANPKENPAEGKGELSLPKNYRPMSVGQRRLEVAEIPGYHLHWFRGTPGNLARAAQAGYTFVERDEVELNDLDLAGGDDGSGTDLGSRVSVISGDDVETKGQAGRLYLMKCREEIWRYAQSLHGEQVDSIAESLRGGMVGAGQAGETGKDVNNRYLQERTKIPKLFSKRT